MNNFETFMKAYCQNLYDAVRDHREEYCFGLDKVPDVVAKMKIAFGQRSYNKDSRAVKATCKQLGIKHTYSAINDYLKQEGK